MARTSRIYKRRVLTLSSLYRVVDRNGNFKSQTGHPPLMGRVWVILFEFRMGLGLNSKTWIGFKSETDFH